MQESQRLSARILATRCLQPSQKTAVKTGKSVRELVLEQGIMTEKELEEVLDPYLMTEVGEERKEDEAKKESLLRKLSVPTYDGNV